MEVVLLGTGGAGGWPNPWCTCASCGSLRREGVVRGETAALVDGTLLLDCGPEAPRAAERAGRSLMGVRHVLLTHGHYDHTGPQALLWRRWAGRGEPVDLVGPAGALDACRPWIGPDDPVRLVPVTAGGRLTLGGYDVRALPATHGDEWSGEAVLYDLTGPGGRLLWGTDTGPLSDAAVDATRGAAYDLVLLEESFGDAPDDRVDHLDLRTFPRQLAVLREAGAVTDRTDVVAVHLGHHNPPTAELSRRLAAYGARVVPDGTALQVGAGSPVPPPPQRTLVLGGARSGKSLAAERLLAAAPDVTYVATGGTRGDDAEWVARVDAHRDRRPEHWRTLETTDLVTALAQAPGPILLDCLSLWLTAVLDDAGAWDGGAAALDTARARVDELVAAWRGVRGQLVAVSNEVGSGVVPATASGRMFRDELGRLNARIGAESDEVLLLVAGQVLPLRPVPSTLTARDS